MAAKPLNGQVALVTGATRGIGKGTALELAAAGAIVYITGRTMKPTDGKFGSLEETAETIRNQGGQCIPVRVDHENADEVEGLFQRIAKEQDGRLDILVNNAFKTGTDTLASFGKTFWQIEPAVFDDFNNVGLCNHYYCTVYAARLMVPRKRGLIVTISSMAGLVYFGFVPHGVGKTACDRMAADTAVELKSHNVVSLSLWPGSVATETVNSLPKIGKLLQSFGKTESPALVGRVITHLAQNPSLMKYTGKIVTTTDYASSNSIIDIDGQYPQNMRSISVFLRNIPVLAWLAPWIPSGLKIPYWLLHQMSNKF